MKHILGDFSLTTDKWKLVILKILIKWVNIFFHLFLTRKIACQFSLTLNYLVTFPPLPFAFIYKALWLCHYGCKTTKWKKFSVKPVAQLSSSSRHLFLIPLQSKFSSNCTQPSFTDTTEYSTSDVIFKKSFKSITYHKETSLKNVTNTDVDLQRYTVN